MYRTRVRTMSAASESPRHAIRSASPLAAFRSKLNVRHENDSLPRSANLSSDDTVHSIGYVSGERFEKKMSWGPENLKATNTSLVRCKNCSHMSYPEAVAEHNRYCPLKPVLCAHVDPRTGRMCGFVSRGQETMIEHEAQCPLRPGKRAAEASPGRGAESSCRDDASESCGGEVGGTQDTTLPTCEYCGVSFKCEIELKDHVALCSEKIVACPLLCGKFIRRGDVTFHVTKELLLHHPMLVPSPEVRPPEDPEVVLALVLNLLLKKSNTDTGGVNRGASLLTPARQLTPRNRIASEPTKRSLTPSRNRIANEVSSRSSTPVSRNKIAREFAARSLTPSRNRIASEPTKRSLTPSRNRIANEVSSRSSTPVSRNKIAREFAARSLTPSRNWITSEPTKRSLTPSRNRIASEPRKRSLTPSRNRIANEVSSRSSTPVSKNKIAREFAARSLTPSRNRIASESTKRSLTPSKNKIVNEVSLRSPTASDMTTTQPRGRSKSSGRGRHLILISKPISLRGGCQQMQPSARTRSTSVPQSAALPSKASNLQFSDLVRPKSLESETSSVFVVRTQQPKRPARNLPAQNAESPKSQLRPSDEVVQDLLNTIKEQRSAVNLLKDEFFTVDAKNMNDYEKQRVRGELKDRMDSIDDVNEETYYKITSFVDGSGALSDHVADVLDRWRSLDRYWYEVKCALHDHIMKV